MNLASPGWTAWQDHQRPSDFSLDAMPAALSLAYTETVRIWLDLPDDVVGQIVEEGKDLSRAALEALAIDAYRMNRISGYQLCDLLSIPSRYDLDAFLKHHGAPLEYTFEDFEREAPTSARLWQRRQAELAAQRERKPRA